MASGTTTIAALSPSLSGACSLAGLVIAKQDPKVLPSKRDPLTSIAVLSFTIRDSVDDIINVTSWGSQRHVAIQAGLFHIGDTVMIQSPVIVIRQPTDVDENYRPQASSPFYLKLNESSSTVFLFEGDDRAYKQLLSMPPGPVNHTPLSDLTASPSVQPVTCSLLAVLRRVCRPRDVSTRQGRQLQSCELRLMDAGCASFGLQLWDAESIRQAQQWPPWETVLFVSDCRVKYDAYRQCAMGVAGSQTIITAHPVISAAQPLLQLARRVRAERAEQLTGDDEIDVSAVKDHCTVLDLEKRLEALRDASGSHVVVVPAFITWFPLDSERYKITKCGRCQRFVPDSEGQCRNSDCTAGAGGQLQQALSLRVNIADHQAGLERLLLEGRAAEETLQMSLSRFEALPEAERIELRFQWLMEHAKIWIRYQMRADGRPFLKILKMERSISEA